MHDDPYVNRIENIFRYVIGTIVILVFLGLPAWYHFLLYYTIRAFG